ncbi:MAG: hypothetical protein GC129_06635 [Proteobacteria bacterium]|nr:hypothetical protein [Pseudomonadota bacterium]
MNTSPFQPIALTGHLTFNSKRLPPLVANAQLAHTPPDLRRAILTVPMPVVGYLRSAPYVLVGEGCDAMGFFSTPEEAHHMALTHTSLSKTATYLYKAEVELSQPVTVYWWGQFRPWPGHEMNEGTFKLYPRSYQYGFCRNEAGSGTSLCTSEHLALKQARQASRDVPGITFFAVRQLYDPLFARYGAMERFARFLNGKNAWVAQFGITNPMPSLTPAVAGFNSWQQAAA